ncbi:MAG: aspartate--tRNA ligase [Clostridiales bacterium]|jgi:aspartyl-tRNA synthetase|nr:aspartate--tRNA ligase [Clostridiales bacterium]
MLRSHTCNELRPENIGLQVKLAGWVSSIRDHGGVKFLDLRDHYGITQLVIHDEAMLEGVNRESTIAVTGKVVARDDDTVNPKLETGYVEVHVESLELLGKCKAMLPFEINDSRSTKEDTRLKYRYLDLRNPKMHDNIMLRSRLINFLRSEMERLGFVEIQTPILTCSSPEGARDFLVPSRRHPGKFYALPQAPQQFKQLLMVSGFDRYYQIAPCFRDEDARHDRSPGEFYQLDYEMSFADQEDVFAVAEEVLYNTFCKFTDKKVSGKPFKRITYCEAMLKYGTDKPDLRNPLEIADLTPVFADVDFPAFRGKQVRGIVADCSGRPRSFFEKMLKFALDIGMKGLGYITLTEGNFKGPIEKFLSEEKKKLLIESLGMKEGETLFFISDSKKLVNNLAGQIRAQLGKVLGLIDEGSFEFCFITDFPMYEISEETGRLEFTHNPFSMPKGGLDALNNLDPLKITAYQYDIVCNGVEISSGAVRNHRPDIMKKAFELAGYSEADLERKFGALYTAFQYGAPPHAGMAPGIERILMLISGEDSIREVIAFPLNGNAQDPMTGAPGTVTEQQLREVHIKLR